MVNLDNIPPGCGRKAVAGEPWRWWQHNLANSKVSWQLDGPYYRYHTNEVGYTQGIIPSSTWSHCGKDAGSWRLLCPECQDNARRLGYVW